VSHVRTSPHELEGNFNFFEHGLGPYWAVSKLLFEGFDGDSGEIDAEIGGEDWIVTLRYQKGGIAPRPEDSDNIERLYEFRIGMNGRGERKANFHVRPRFADMENFETGDEITSPCDHDQCPNEATNVHHLSGSNIEPDDYPVLLRKALQALAADAALRVNPNYFVQLHETSNITTYERYVRVRRTMAKKFVRSTGAMRRILEYVSRYQYASRTHVVFALLWRTGIRTGSIRALDVGDFYPDEQALELVHRPETGTPLKNKQNAERMVALDGRLIRMLEEYIDGPRHDKKDEYDRELLVTTQQGRPAASTIRDTIYRITRPCTVGKECPHDRDPDDCPAMETRSSSRCPSSRSPHDIRSGAITAHLLEDVPVEIVSERCDVSRDVLDRHYDRRTEREKMEQRRDYLPSGPMHFARNGRDERMLNGDRI